MAVVRKSNAYVKVDAATCRQTRSRGDARFLTLLAACIVLAVSSWFAVDHSSAPQQLASRQIVASAANIQASASHVAIGRNNQVGKAFDYTTP